MIRLALLRHGHTAWNRAGRIQGRTDIPLDEEARQVLTQLRLPCPFDDAHIWSSTLSRARETAELVSGRSPLLSDALIEMNWGDWEGREGKHLSADPNSGFRHLEDWGWNFAPPGGESPAAMRGRLIPWAESLSGNSVAVCHIGVMRVLLAHATGWNFEGSPPFTIKRNRLYVISIAGNDWKFETDQVRLEERTQ